MSHGHSSQKEPFTAERGLINQPEKTTASLLSPQPAPSLATVQGHCTTSCRKHQTLTSLHPPLSKIPGSSTQTDERQQRKYQQVLVYPLLILIFCRRHHSNWFQRPSWSTEVLDGTSRHMLLAQGCPLAHSLVCVCTLRNGFPKASEFPVILNLCLK